MLPCPRRLALSLALLAAPACGNNDEPPPAGKQPRTTPTQAEPPPLAGDSTGGSTTEPAEEDWGEVEEPTSGAGGTGGVDDTAGDDTAGGEAPAKAHLGPCSVSWTKSTRLLFKYDDDGGGGSVRIDGDRDGKSDICAKFEIADGRTSKVEVDEGCDKKFDGTMTPAYDAKSNVATMQLEPTKAGEDPTDLTLVVMPTFSGVAPGYVLWAAKKDVKIKLRKGLVSTATVTDPSEGPPVKATFTYDTEGRVKRITEDFDNDGSVDRKFDYRFDEVGNVTRITLTMGPKGEETKISGSPSYKCWAEADSAG